MVRAGNLVVDSSICEVVLKRLTDEKIINTPANIVFSGISIMRPPSILDFIWMKSAKSINKALTDNIGNSLSFLIGEASALAILFRAGKIDVLVGSVKVATENYRFGFF